jgi:hypothetical protein
MGIYCETREELGIIPLCQEGGNDDAQWQRWDEELVEEFGRWLSRVAKVFGILFFATFSAVFIGWL